MDTIDRKKLAGQIQGLHVAVALLARDDPKFQQIILLSDQEAVNLGNALGDVFEHYGVKLDGPVGCLVQLVAVGGMVYVPRLNALGKLRRQRQAQQQSPTMASSPDEVAATMGNGAYTMSHDPVTGAPLS